jgi:hypothetical protein
VSRVCPLNCVWAGIPLEVRPATLSRHYHILLTCLTQAITRTAHNRHTTGPEQHLCAAHMAHMPHQQKHASYDWSASMTITVRLQSCVYSNPLSSSVDCRGVNSQPAAAAHFLPQQCTSGVLCPLKSRHEAYTIPCIWGQAGTSQRYAWDSWWMV